MTDVALERARVSPGRVRTALRGVAGPLFEPVTVGAPIARPWVLPLFLVATLVTLGRQVGAGLLDSVWAEDGAVFLSDAYRLNLLDAIREPYAGYFHLVPRLLAEPVSHLAPAQAAAALGLLAAVAAGAQALLVLHISRTHLRSTVARVIAAGVLVALPLAGSEIANTICNLHWLLLYTSFWVLVWTPAKRWELAVGSVVLVLATFSDPLLLCLVPLALVRLLVVRGRRDQLLALVFLACFAVSTIAMLSASGERAIAPQPNVVKIAAWYVVAVVGRASFGVRLLGDAVPTPIVAVLLAAAVLGVAAVAAVARRDVRANGLAHGRSAGLAVAALVCSVAFYVLPVFLTGVRPDRYAVVPTMLLLTAAVAVFDGMSASLGRLRRPVLIAATALLLAVTLVDLRTNDGRESGPRWSSTVRAAERTCASNPDLAYVRVAIPPTVDDHDWRAAIPCDRT